MDRFQQARTQTMLKHPFYGTLIASSKLIETDQVETAATDMKDIFYNKQFMAGLPNVRQVAFVFVHEVMHKALLHGFRKGSRNHTVWNYATDYAINAMLIASGMEMPECGLYDRKYENMSAEAIYDALIQECEEKAKERAKNGEEGGYTDHLPDNPMDGDIMDPVSGMDADAQRELTEKIKQQVAQAVTVARQCGRLPGHIERMITGILHPVVPWQDLLRQFMLATVQENENWSRRNRRVQNVYLPRRHSEAMGEIVFIADTSGSIGEAELNQVASEIQAVADLTRPERIRVLWADAQVQGEQVFEQGEELELRPIGGGGTDMRVALTKAEEYDPQIVVLLTDGYTPWPDSEPPYPLIVCCTTDVKVPVGMEVRV